MDATTPDPRIAKLPQWVQYLLRDKQREIDTLTQALSIARGDADAAGDPRTPVAVLDPFERKIPVAYTEYDRIRFALRTLHDGAVAQWIDVRNTGETLELQASGAVLMAASAANVVEVSLRRY